MNKCGHSCCPLPENSYVPSSERGFVLLAVVLAIILLAAIAFALTNQGTSKVNVAAGELQSDRLRYVTEAGLAHTGWQLRQNTTCTGYANVPNTVFGVDSYSATLSPNSNSPVTITGTGTLSAGTQRVLIQSDVKVYGPAASQTVTLQPGPEGEDTFILQNNPTENRGNNVDLVTDSNNAGTGRVHTLLRFDLSSVPSSTTIVSADLGLYLYANSGNPDVVEAHSMQRGWVEGVGLVDDGANWNTSDGSLAWGTAGGDYDAAIAGSFVASGTGWMNLDLTALAQGWVDGSRPNYGVALISPPAPGTNTKQYHSSDFTTANLRPKLTLTLTCECGKVCTGGGSACDGTFRDEFNARSFSGSDGTLAWAGDWLEVGESNGATTGDIQVRNNVSNYQLRTRDNNNGGEGVEREADLSLAGSATLSYDYRRSALDSSSDYTSVEVSANGVGGPWTELTRHQGPTNDGSYVPTSHDISAFLSPNTRIRFKTSPSMGNKDIVWFDDIQILCSP